MRFTFFLPAVSLLLVACVSVNMRDEGHLGHDDKTMDDMVADIADKEGDAFDEAFLRGMIEHHQGALDMARIVKVKAKHEELKTMADEIIAAQQREIDQMRTWLREWGYDD